jgi:hypothetical protein
MILVPDSYNEFRCVLHQRAVGGRMRRRRWAAVAKPSRPRTHPERFCGDAGFDCEATWVFLRWLGIKPHIRHRYGHHLGLRRMRVRNGRSGTLIDAWARLATAVVCLHIPSEAVGVTISYFYRLFVSL